jgi:pimeloyl-ACP methyl ester carboxylesterase
MSTYVLIHGAGSDSWYWHRVVPYLKARGHSVVAPDLPCDDDSAGLAEYTDVVVRAICDPHRRPKPLIVVAQSMGGFTAPIVADRIPVDLIVMLNAMIPLPQERLGAWWSLTGFEAARREALAGEGRRPSSNSHTDDAVGFDVMRDFFHDVPKDVVEAAFQRGERRQSGTPFGETWPLGAWPPVRTRFLLARDDRFFPADFMRRVVKERLGIVPDEMPGGHLVALSRPEELADRLEAICIEMLD